MKDHNERIYDDFDDFDGFAKNYRETHDKAVKLSGADSDYFSKGKIIELLKYENADQKLKILDFGCGDGNSSRFIRHYFPKATIYGIDVSAQSIEIARKRNIPNSKFVIFDGKKLSFRENKFDIVFTSMVFHHVNHNLHLGILKEINRILITGGKFYNFEHNPYNPLTRKVVNECVFDEDAVLLKPSYNKSITEASGLKVDKLIFTLFVPRHRNFKFLIKFERLLTWLSIGAQYYMPISKVHTNL